MYSDDPFEQFGKALLVLLVLVLGFFAPELFFHLIGPHDLYHIVVGWAVSQHAFIVLPFWLAYEALGVAMVIGTWLGLVAIGRLLFEIILDLSTRACAWATVQAERAIEAFLAALTAAVTGALVPVRFTFRAAHEAFSRIINGTFGRINEAADLRRAYRTEYRDHYASFREFKDAFDAANGQTTGAEQKQRQDQPRTAQKKTGGGAAGKGTSGGGLNFDPAYWHATLQLGLLDGFTREDLKRRYRECMKRAHPDLEGSATQARNIIAAYGLIKQRKGWT